MLLVEVRLYGSAWRAERGAVWRVRRLAREARLEMYVRRAELADRDRELLPEWRVHTTAHRPAPPLVRPVPRRTLLAYRWARARARAAERLGLRDTGAVVTGTPSEAWRLARLPLSPGRHGPRAWTSGRWTAGRGPERCCGVRRTGNGA